MLSSSSMTSTGFMGRTVSIASLVSFRRSSGEREMQPR
jgi:hypothetical protein